MNKKKAVLQDQFETSGADRCLWLTDEGDYIVTSSICRVLILGFKVEETMAFPSNRAGEIVEFNELGVIDQEDCHVEVMRDLGYEPVMQDA